MTASAPGPAAGRLMATPMGPAGPVLAQTAADVMMPPLTR
ncbi:hypothetical protein EES43_29590 [Streptomyces sp. ADI96-02]|nr:hypothetical protein EES43_29590 [Streptomyces sp. ADI96-02]